MNFGTSVLVIVIGLVVGGLVGAGLMWWFGIHKKKIPDVVVNK